MAEISTFIP